MYTTLISLQYAMVFSQCIETSFSDGCYHFYQAKVLEPLGAVTTGSQFLEPDGNI